MPKKIKQNIKVLLKGQKPKLRLQEKQRQYIRQRVGDMRYKYDSKTDIIMIELSNGRPDFGEQKENIITHYNKRGIPMEIEILDASKTVA